MDVTYLPPGIMRMDHGSYQEYCYNNMLVVADDITQAVVCNDSTAQQEQVQYSQKYPFANRIAEKEDEIYLITVKDIAEAQRAHKTFQNTSKSYQWLLRQK